MPSRLPFLNPVNLDIKSKPLIFSVLFSALYTLLGLLTKYMPILVYTISLLFLLSSIPIYICTYLSIQIFPPCSISKEELVGTIEMLQVLLISLVASIEKLDPSKTNPLISSTFCNLKFNRYILLWIILPFWFATLYSF